MKFSIEDFFSKCDQFNVTYLTYCLLNVSFTLILWKCYDIFIFAASILIQSQVV